MIAFRELDQFGVQVDSGALFLKPMIPSAVRELTTTTSIGSYCVPFEGERNARCAVGLE